MKQTTRNIPAKTRKMVAEQLAIPEIHPAQKAGAAVHQAVENGLATLRDCNISANTLTGISAVSTDEARLHIEDSDVRANRSDQMELPSPSSGRSINRNNTIATVGLGRPRSSHLKESSSLNSPRGAREPSTPQSPLE